MQPVAEKLHARFYLFSYCLSMKLILTFFQLAKKNKHVSRSERNSWFLLHLNSSSGQQKLQQFKQETGLIALNSAFP